MISTRAYFRGCLGCVDARQLDKPAQLVLATWAARLNRTGGEPRELPRMQIEDQASQGNQRDKLVANLKEQIKKLQKDRDKIKTWSAPGTGHVLCNHTRRQLCVAAETGHFSAARLARGLAAVCHQGAQGLRHDLGRARRHTVEVRNCTPWK